MPADRLPRRGRAGGDPRQRRRHPARRARRPGEPGRGAPRACSRTRPGGASSARRRARPSSARSPGRRAGARRSPPTRRRCGEARPLRHQPRAAVPRRRVREAARARGRDVRADRRRRPPRRRRGGGAGPAVPRDPAARSTRSRGSRGDYRAVVAGLSGRVAPLAAYVGARAGRACRSCSGRACGRTRRRSPTPRRTCRCATCTATPTRSSPTGRTSPRMCAPRARARPSSRPHRASITGIGTDQSAPIRRAAFQAAFVGRIAGEKGPQVLIQAWSSSGLPALSAALVLVGGGPIRARAAATGAVLPEGPALAGRSTQLLCGERRCRRTVGPDPRLPRAVGPGGQRSLQPGSPRDRLRCRRRRRRRPRPPRAHRARRPRRGRPARSPPRCAGCTTSRRCGRGWGPPGGRRSRPTRTTRGRPECQARLRPWERAVASVEAHGSSADAQRADPAARCSHGERGRPREDPARVPGRPHHRQLHAEAAPRRAQAHPHRHRRVLRLPRRARAGRAGRPAAGRAASGAAARPARRAACCPDTGAQPADRRATRARGRRSTTRASRARASRSATRA